MRRILSPLFALALAAAPATLGAQAADSTRPEARSPMERISPIAFILTHGSELDLSADQVGRLETIQARLAEQNRPLLEQLEAARRDVPGGRPARPREMTREERQQMRERMKELRPVMEQVRENNSAAMTEAREVLTAEQWTRLEELRREAAPRRGARPGRLGPRGRRLPC